MLEGTIYHFTSDPKTAVTSHPDKDLVFLSRARGGCDQYVCPACPGQLINPSQLLCEENLISSDPIARRVFTAINFIQRSPPPRFWMCTRSIQSAALMANFKPAVAIFINKQTNPCKELVYLYCTNLVTALLLIRKERSERALLNALVMHGILPASLLPCHSYCRPEVQRVT